MENDVQTDITKQAQAIFSWKVVTPFHPEVFLNEISECSVSKKHLSLHLDLKLEFSKHINKEHQSLKNLIFCQEMCF